MSDRRFFANITIAVALLLIVQSTRAAECKSITGIASNEIHYLAGNRDTVWMVTHEGNNRYAINTLAGNGALSDRMIVDSNWNALYLCNTTGIEDIAYSSGVAVVLSDSVWHKPNEVYVVSKQNGFVSKTLTFPWTDKIKNKDSLYVTAVEVTESGDLFYFACLDGGMVRWDSKTDRMRVLIPGKAALPFDSLDGSAEFSSDRHVTAVNSCGDSIIVTTPNKIWIYTQNDSSWDSTVSTTLGQSGVTIKSFYSAFVNNRTKSSPLYGFMYLSGKNYSEDSLVFCKYDRSRAQWNEFLKKPPSGITMGNDGVMYVLSGLTIEVYLDTLADSVSESHPTLLSRDREVQDSMTAKYSIDFPAYITDVFFAPLSDSTGNLWIATSEGLFLSEGVSRSRIIRECDLIKRAPSVKGGLKKTYARPGILTTRYSDSGNDRSVFVYNLSKDANVTIKVYDYNMDHVKTVISGKARKAGNNGGPFGRSTIESEDWWDGRNELGRSVAPGVYYYKISTDKGERAFGKMVVAK